MYIYNVTCKVFWEIRENWLQWMKETHIPEVLATGCFSGSRMYRLLDIDDAEGPTYIIQYSFLTLEKFRAYEKDFAPELRNELTRKWGHAFIAFRTLMQEME